ncbi:glycoprotease family-domain-containing protein [Stachybotrys elegans]|uniref:N(6)-L-threonylcarbamoyladenine synthase n=1 Tax=Stachybotrys elegans TaxID=80388 RepID=A0A8K0T4M4_9HYPO|nr:glycoprotease family-domain-containing protein [Stachybotrys elegans]
MNATTQSRLPATTSPIHREVDDWEDWENESVVTPIEAAEQVSNDGPRSSTRRRSNSHTSTRYSVSRPSRNPSSKIKRLKSRHRQKAQNAKAGIKLITDMSSFRRQTNHVRTPDGRPVRFVDAATLRALEGEPSSATVGNWNWLKRNKGQSPVIASPERLTESPAQLSPEDRPIVIGISLPSDVASSREFSPQTATIDTPISQFGASGSSNYAPSRAPPQTSQMKSNQLKSVWSPDTPDTTSSFSPDRHASSIYSQYTMQGIQRNENVPPVPALPADYKKKTPRERLISLEIGMDDDENNSPCTLFEEDGATSPQKQAKVKSSATPDSASSRSHGWWDHVITPFTERRLTLQSRMQKLESPREEAEEAPSSAVISEKQDQATRAKPSIVYIQPPIVRVPTPRRSPSPRADTLRAADSQSSSSAHPEIQSTTASTQVSEKPRFLVSDFSTESPPPYSPPHLAKGAPVKYRAVFPPGHPLESQFPPTPVPSSPAVNGTMASPGGIRMTEIPLTPTHHDPSQTQLPIRPAGTFLPHEHAYAANGRGNKVERQRRRHEKEEVVARRLGGFWRGRGCIPKSGCFGRSGREGRKRRRVWMIVIGIAIALITLAVVLGVMLTRPDSAPEMESIWVNLTNYPPMPTGVLTVVGPDNTVSYSGCTAPSTLWSCSLPKEQHESVAPYSPNQPTIVMQIQWDNDTRETWNTPNGERPEPLTRRGMGLASIASRAVRARQTTNGFRPDPSPPEYKEMFFLGNTTDDIQSEEKGGEPTPFYISLLDSVNQTITTPTLSKRQGNRIGNISLEEILPDPALNEDGTPAAAVMLPKPVQQPVRLYDRGLPTEHYGFYTHFRRTIFLKSVTGLNDTDEGDVPLDEDGGSRETEADFLTTWGETRVLVQIWTRKFDNNSASLLRPNQAGGINGSTVDLIRPGTMPYPVTVTLDTHGGDPEKKLTWAWPINNRQRLELDQAELLANVMSNGGTWVNRRGRGDEKFGGFDGGSGGCKCRPPRCLSSAARPRLLAQRPSIPRRTSRSLTTLAIESSCDDSGVAILERTGGGATTLLFNERITSDHRQFKGIHPAVSIVGHMTQLGPLVQRAVALARSSRGAAWKPDFVSVTRGPGMMSGLATGLATAKGLAAAWDVPLVGVHHMQAHALTPLLAAALGIDIATKAGEAARRPEFPFLSLLVSGGHTLLVHSVALTDHRVAVDAIDSAVGNVLDQVARAILPPDALAACEDVMYARALEAFAFPNGAADYAFFAPSPSRIAETRDEPTGYGWALPLPFRESRRLSFSFSQVHSLAMRIAETIDPGDVAQRRALARHAFAATFRHVAGRICLAVEDDAAGSLRTASTLVVSGGVASNRFLMHVLRTTLDARGMSHMQVVAPPPALCVDNAAMIAWAGMEMFEAGWHTDLSVVPKAKWPLDPGQEGGIMGLDGWLRRDTTVPSS